MGEDKQMGLVKGKKNQMSGKYIDSGFDSYYFQISRTIYVSIGIHYMIKSIGQKLTLTMSEKAIYGRVPTLVRRYRAINQNYPYARGNKRRNVKNILATHKYRTEHT